MTAATALVARADVSPVTWSTFPTAPVVGSIPHAQPDACAICRVRQLCLPAQFAEDALVRFNRAIPIRRRVTRGTRVVQFGDKLASLYAIRVGFFKSYAVSEDGAMQVLRFAMPGELLGLDGVATGRHSQTFEALDYSEVCEIPYASITRLASAMPELRDAMEKAFGQAMHRQQALVMMLGSMRVEARMAAFLLDLAQKFTVRGYSPRAFLLPMSRRDIAAYLAITGETVTRALMALKHDGVIALSGCRVEILDLQRLQLLQTRSA